MPILSILCLKNKSYATVNSLGWVCHLKTPKTSKIPCEIPCVMKHFICEKKFAFLICSSIF